MRWVVPSPDLPCGGRAISPVVVAASYESVGSLDAHDKIIARTAAAAAAAATGRRTPDDVRGELAVTAAAR